MISGEPISILIPAYNAAPYLYEAVKSLLLQDVDMEIIICDDGSNDDTPHIASNLAKTDKRVQWFSQSNSGAAAARNAAFERSTGRWIYYFDADDLLAPRSLFHMRKLAELFPNDGVFVPWRKFFESPTKLLVDRSKIRGSMTGVRWLEEAFILDEPTYPGRFLFPRSHIEKCGGWDQRLGFQDDMEFFARQISRVPMMRHCDAAIFYYRQGVVGSLSNTLSERAPLSQLLATQLAVNHLLSVSSSRTAKRGTVRQLMLVAHTQFIYNKTVSEIAERDARAVSKNYFFQPWLKGGVARRFLQLLVGWKAALIFHSKLASVRLSR